MNKSLLIIGHGIAGTALAMACLRRNIPFQLAGFSLPGEASPASSGLIAPITGRRYVKTWRIDEFLASALDFYRWTETVLETSFFYPIDIVRFLPNAEAQQAWRSRLNDPEYNSYISHAQIQSLDQFKRPYGIMTGGYRLDTPGWLDACHRHLEAHSSLQRTAMESISIDRNQTCIIWATGATFPHGAHGIVPNKGEALIVRMPEWIYTAVIKEEVYVVPLEDGLFWIGSYYERYPTTPHPTEAGKQDLLDKLGAFYAGPVEMVRHLAGIRPTVMDRRPIIGLHPEGSGDYLFNGMGTKGTSLAPFWADQLISHLFDGLALPAEVSPARYTIASIV